ncbi:hypothetical protein ABIB56_003438 [Glaciihabitans sp. UYNi722]
MAVHRGLSERIAKTRIARGRESQSQDNATKFIIEGTKPAGEAADTSPKEEATASVSVPLNDAPGSTPSTVMEQRVSEVDNR